MAPAAAGVAALNPLVYWHQIFGRTTRCSWRCCRRCWPRAPGAASRRSALGLACATKQLAGRSRRSCTRGARRARSGRDRPATWRRLAAPLAAAALVFLLVVLPVALLDLRAFWADVFVYNAGLRSGDNYPLGGTPGFGFANFLIYFGWVSDLRQYFPFSVFYPLLVPPACCRARRCATAPEWALATGSAALPRPLTSRVVHPNYQIVPAVLPAVAVLAARRRRPPSLRCCCSRSRWRSWRRALPQTWEQAAGAGHARARRALARRRQRASAAIRWAVGGRVAAGLGVPSLAAATGLTRRARRPLAAVAFALVASRRRCRSPPSRRRRLVRAGSGGAS